MTKYLLLDHEDVILHISSTIGYQENGNPLVDAGTLAYAAALVAQVVEVDDVPDEVSAHEYCHADGVFTPNPNWIDPDTQSDTISVHEVIGILTGEVS